LQTKQSKLLLPFGKTNEYDGLSEGMTEGKFDLAFIKRNEFKSETKIIFLTMTRH
jgi:hypothetical protein